MDNDKAIMALQAILDWDADQQDAPLPENLRRAAQDALEPAED